jgi:hypothetical protein
MGVELATVVDDEPDMVDMVEMCLWRSGSNTM